MVEFSGMRTFLWYLRLCNNESDSPRRDVSTLKKYFCCRENMGKKYLSWPLKVLLPKQWALPYHLTQRKGNISSLNWHTETQHLRDLEAISKPTSEIQSCQSCRYYPSSFWRSQVLHFKLKVSKERRIIGQSGGGGDLCACSQEGEFSDK